MFHSSQPCGVPRESQYSFIPSIHSSLSNTVKAWCDDLGKSSVGRRRRKCFCVHAEGEGIITEDPAFFLTDVNEKKINVTDDGLRDERIRSIGAAQQAFHHNLLTQHFKIISGEDHVTSQRTAYL